MVNLPDYSIQVRQRGQLTIPQKVRDALAIKDGDVLTLVQVGEGFFLTPRRLRTLELADTIADMLDESQMTLADLLADLPRIREEIYGERYGDNAS
jgi:bifunctional DNA-binding transcriptional regulator/antitoxin component of YhaV-PrlF toxin-antitoxin module